MSHAIERYLEISVLIKKNRTSIPERILHSTRIMLFSYRLHICKALFLWLMASASSVPTSTKETTTYARLCRVLVDLGTCALRDCFDAIFTPPTLHKVLAATQPTLQSLRSRRIINVTQWGNLFPSTPASVSSTDFDITLLMILFRNICGMAPPLTGWDALPAAKDVSREVDIARIKYFRNSIYAHADHASIDDATFDDYWKKIRDTLVRLGGVKYKVRDEKCFWCFV